MSILICEFDLKPQNLNMIPLQGPQLQEERLSPWYHQLLQSGFFLP
jgi:hypothetical protein